MIDLDKIREIYDEDMIISVKENMSDVKKNINFMVSLGFDDVVGLFESCTPVFIMDANEFKTKMTNLINKLGDDYVRLIEEDLNLLESIE